MCACISVSVSSTSSSGVRQKHRNASSDLVFSNKGDGQVKHSTEVPQSSFSEAFEHVDAKLNNRYLMKCGDLLILSLSLGSRGFLEPLSDTLISKSVL